MWCVSHKSRLVKHLEEETLIWTSSTGFFPRCSSLYTCTLLREMLSRWRLFLSYCQDRGYFFLWITNSFTTLKRCTFWLWYWRCKFKHDTYFSYSDRSLAFVTLFSVASVASVAQPLQYKVLFVQLSWNNSPRTLTDEFCWKRNMFFRLVFQGPNQLSSRKGIHELENDDDRLCVVD